MSLSQEKIDKRIAVMGGTFDPIHYGHLVAAEAVRCELNIERVIFVPAGTPPHKKTRVTCAETRYNMTVLATESNPHFTVSRIETDRTGETYTIDTVRLLREQYPDAEIFFITGADAVHQILTWRNAEELLKLCTFVAVTRPGNDVRVLERDAERLKVQFSSRLQILEIPALAISSSDIRSRCSAGKTVSYLLPEPVEVLIKRERLYSNDDLKELARARLSEERYAHTLGVHKTALELAWIHGASCEKAAIAALLHDIAKESPDKLALCEERGIKIDEFMREYPDLTHAFLGAEIARTELGINDSEILDAIAGHTLGRKNMSVLEKIILLADLTEPTRDDHDRLDELRELSRKDLDAAVIAGLQSKRKYTGKKAKKIHPMSIETLEYYKNKTKTGGMEPDGFQWKMQGGRHSQNAR